MAVGRGWRLQLRATEHKTGHVCVWFPVWCIAGTCKLETDLPAPCHPVVPAPWLAHPRSGQAGWQSLFAPPHDTHQTWWTETPAPQP